MEYERKLTEMLKKCLNYLFFKLENFKKTADINNIYAHTISFLYKYIIRRPYIIKDWDENLYYQYSSDNIAFNIKRKAVSDAVNITNYINLNLKPGDICIDIGACIGATTIPMWKKVGHKGRVYSIEADESNINKIKNNLNLNNFPNKYVFDYAICAKNESVVLNVIEGQNGWQSLGNPKLDLGLKDSKITQKKVKGMTLDSFLNINDIRHVNFLKIDVEGGEVDVFSGAKKALINKNIDYIAFEISPQMLKWHKRKPNEVLSYIKNYGYLLYKIEENGSVKKIGNKLWTKYGFGDCLAVSPRINEINENGK